MDLIWQISFYLFIIAIPVGVLYFMYQAKIKKEKIEWYEAKKNIVLSILVPKENEKKPIAAEQMFASLHGIFKPENKFQDQISFEIVSKDKYIQFYVCLPNYMKDFVEGQIYAQYPDVEIYEANDYTMEKIENNFVASALLELNKSDVYPLKTFPNFEVDPLAAITGVLSKVDGGEQIWIQTIVKPVSDAWQLKGVSHVAALKSGQSVGKASTFNKVAKSGVKLFSEIFKTLFFPSATPSVEVEKQLSGPEQEALKEIERKSTKLGFATKIRVVAIAKDSYTAKNKIETLVGAYKQYSTTNLNALVLRKIYLNNPTIENYRKRKFYDDGFILNIEELASLYHLPTIMVETPNIVWAGSKKGEPPSNLPVVGTVSNDDLTVLAKTNFRNNENTFGIKRRDRSLHMYIIGKTGTGKSTLLENMIIDDILKGQGVAYIDPHGDAIEHILEHIPDERIGDVVYFNPSDKEWPIGFNPLEAVNPELKNIVASGVVGIFKKIFGESWGPRLEYILRNALLAAVDYPNSTLLSVMRILTDDEYRYKVISKINDPVIQDFFFNEYNKYDPKFQREAIAPIQNKVGQFLSSSIIRNIVGQPKSSIDLLEIMDKKKIFLVDLSVGKIGEDNSALLGAMLITKFQLAAMQRATQAVEKRKDFYLYVDEFQNFATDSFAVILSEARKYKLNLTMTNQYIAQMQEEVANAIFGNIGTMISFRVGASDAASLVKEYEPVFTANDLVNLNNYNIYIKMAIDGVTRPAFSAVTLDRTAPLTNNREKIIRLSREKYAKPQEFVETKIKEWNEEIKQARFVAEEKKKQKSYEKFNKKRDYSGYYTFIDTKGQKWFIPNNPTIKSNDNKDELKIDKNDQKDTKNESTAKTQENVKNEDKKIDFKFIKGFSKKNESLETKKLDNNTKKNVLISPDELEKIFSKDNR